jgi:hypothetical protein
MAEKYVLDEKGEPKLDADGNKILATPEKTPKVELPEGVDPKVIKALVQEGIDAALQPIKENLDKAYASRDELAKQVAEFQQKEREAEIQRLKEEGNHKEAYEKELAAIRAERDALGKTNVKLTRDIEVRNALTAHEFRSANAREMAFKEIVGDLVQNEQGVWVHKSGTPITDHITSFVSNEDNSFLLKQKVNSGTGQPPTTTSVKPTEETSLFKRPQAEVLQMAAEGKLPNQQ